MTNIRFRELKLNDRISGRIYLHHMPARDSYGESFSDFKIKLKYCKVDMIVNLCSLEEVKQKSNRYYDAIKNDELEIKMANYPIKDYGVPKEKQNFIQFIEDVVQELKNGRNILVHCGAGIGRTGLFASCILAAIGFDANHADMMVKNAGSEVETSDQRKYLNKIRIELLEVES